MIARLVRAASGICLFLAAAGTALAVGGNADISIYDRTARCELPVYWHEGRPWVEGRPGHEFEVRVRSRSGGDLLAVVSVDGVNAVSGETASASQGGYVLAPWTGVDIKGWRKSLSHTAAFYFTPLPDSYAARTGRPDNVGVVGVALFRRKAVEPAIARPVPEDAEARGNAGTAPPAAEAAQQAAPAPKSADRAASASRLGTGHGRSEISRVREVEFQRATDDPEETIVIYYDGRRNLMARGIIPPYHMPEPDPFPARFAPDPPPRG